VLLDYADLQAGADLTAAIQVRPALQRRDSGVGTPRPLTRSSTPLPAEPAAISQEAFGDGPECLGILLVRGVPEYPALRRRLLPLASAFAELPEEVRRKYERPESVYSFGWSHGKEMFNGKPGA